jgi:hypothetical protein
LHDISCITVKVCPFLNVNEVPSIKLGHVKHLLSVHFFTDGDDSWNSNFDDDKKRFRFFGCLLLLLIIFFFLQYIFHTFATVQVKFNLFHKMENIVIPWIISSYKRIILFWFEVTCTCSRSSVCIGPSSNAFCIPCSTISFGYCWFFIYNLSSRSHVSLNSSVFVIVIILEAKLNGMFILICFGWLDLKLRYIWVSVSFEKMSVIMFLFVELKHLKTAFLFCFCLRWNEYGHLKT